jgi:hypothetical protein
MLLVTVHGGEELGRAGRVRGRAAKQRSATWRAMQSDCKSNECLNEVASVDCVPWMYCTLSPVTTLLYLHVTKSWLATKSVSAPFP